MGTEGTDWSRVLAFVALGFTGWAVVNVQVVLSYCLTRSLDQRGARPAWLLLALPGAIVLGIAVARCVPWPTAGAPLSEPAMALLALQCFGILTGVLYARHAIARATRQQQQPQHRRQGTSCRPV